MGTVTYTCRIRHQGLNAYRVIKGHDKTQIQSEAHRQISAWTQQWAELQRQATSSHLQVGRNLRDASKAWAAFATLQMQRVVGECDRILAIALDVDNRLDFEKLKSQVTFNLPEPEKPILETIAHEPDRTDHEFDVGMGLLDRLSSSRREKRIREMDVTFATAHADWRIVRDRLNSQNTAEEQRYDQEMSDWRAAKDRFCETVAKSNATVDDFRDAYLNHDVHAVKRYVETVLNSSKYRGASVIEKLGEQ